MKNKRLSFSALLHNNQFVFIFSIVAAVVIWFAVSYSVNRESATVITGVPVIINTETPALQTLGLDVVGSHKYEIQVKIVCKPYHKGLIEASDIQTSVDLSNVTSPGEHPLDIIVGRAANSKYPFTISEVNPSFLKLNFDRFNTVTVDVTPRQAGAGAPAGLRVDTPVLADAENNKLEVKGPESTVSRIASAVVEAKVDKTLEKTETFTGDVILYDNGGQVIDKEYLSLSFTKAKITVPISRLKEVEVAAVFTNVPDAYKDTPIAHTLNINKVTISGPPDIVDSITKLSLEPIDFGTISQDSYRFNQKIMPPAGVRVTDESIKQVRVTVSYKNLITKTMDVTKFSYVGLPAGKTAQVIMNKLPGVTIAGPRASVNAIRESDVYAELNVSDKLSSGEYEIIATIKFYSHKDVWALNPAKGQYTVFVKIS